ALPSPRDRIDEGIWLVSFMHYDLGYIDLEQKKCWLGDTQFASQNAISDRLGSLPASYASRDLFQQFISVLPDPLCLCSACYIGYQLAASICQHSTSLRALQFPPRAPRMSVAPA